MNRRNATVLAFDYGLRNIGVAVGNLELGTCEPLAVIAARDGAPNWQQVTSCLDTWRPGIVVVGDPINMDGTPSDMSRRAQRFARQLEGRYGCAVNLMDERLSSHAAKEQARAAGHRGDYDQSPIDAHAAALILQSWFNAASD